MKTQKRILQDSIKREIATREKQLANLERLPINLISEVFPNCHWSNSWLNSFECTLPFDFSLIATVREFMQMHFPNEWKLKRENQFVWDSSKDAGHFLEYETTEENYWDRVEFQFAFRTGREGTTCVLNEIGKKEVPIYEVICSEQAKEW